MAEEVFDFDEEYEEEEEARQITPRTFRFHGKEFHTRDRLPAGALMRSTGGFSAATQILRFLLVPEDRIAFFEMLDDPDIEPPISANKVDTLAGRLMRQVAEDISGRPTESPASSSNGVGRTKKSSKAVSSSQAETGGS